MLEGRWIYVRAGEAFGMSVRWRLLSFLHRKLVGQDEVQAAKRVLSDHGAVVYLLGDGGDADCVMLALKPFAVFDGECALHAVRNDRIHITDRRSDKSKPLLSIAS